MTAEASGEQAEDLAATMLASTLDLDFDPEAAWNARKQIYEHSSLIISPIRCAAAFGKGFGCRPGARGRPGI
jgi:arginine decarboxylase